jgi:serine/threonine-protein kinase
MGPALPSPGDVFAGKYKIVRSLGEGGMGLVLEAFHSRLKQRFAIKFLRPSLQASDEFIGRFEREARAAARLKSPHVVRVFDIDCTQDGVHYIVMEYLEGNDLASELSKQSVPLDQLVDWTVQVCSAISEAHEAGIVHRDLKPANIFLTLHERKRIAKVLDFGVSKLMALDESDSTPATDVPIGTLQFMSPEQFVGGTEIDGRTDIWALGVILYRALTKRYPFSAPTQAGLALAITTTPAMPIRMLRPDLPAPFAAAIMQTLEKEPGRRFPRVKDFARAILPYGSGREPLPASVHMLQGTPAGELETSTTELAATTTRVDDPKASPPGEPDPASAFRTLTESGAGWEQPGGVRRGSSGETSEVVRMRPDAPAPTGRRWPWSLALLGLLAGSVAAIATLLLPRAPPGPVAAASPHAEEIASTVRPPAAWTPPPIEPSAAPQPAASESAVATASSVAPGSDHAAPPHRSGPVASSAQPAAAGSAPRIPVHL